MIATSRLMNFARDLSRAGSDIVVEEDLANLFGYTKVQKSMEDDFRKEVALSLSVPITDGSEVELRLGTGPTMLRAFKKDEHKYFATFILVSLLSFYTGRESLAQALSVTIRKQMEARREKEFLDPGYEGIMRTVRSCNTQARAFDWGRYVQRVEQTFEHSIPNYRRSQDYCRLTPTILLGAVEFFHITQDLPDRKVSFSNQMGCIILIIWAHFIMGLSVKITGEKIQSIVFGAPDDVQVYINWTQEPASALNDADEFWWSTGSLKEDTIVRLHDGDPTTSILLECKPEKDEKLQIEVKERHPLAGYGTTYLRRILNVSMITDETNPLYSECVKMAVALAIHASRRMCRVISFSETASDEKDVKGLAHHYRPISLPLWRIMDSAAMLFDGMSVDERGITSYGRNLEEMAFNDEGALPPGIASRIKKAKGDDSTHLQRQIKYLAKLVLLFAHVVNVKTCGEMPLILHEDHGGFWQTINPICENLNNHGGVAAASAFHSIMELLSSAPEMDTDSEASETISGRKKFYLCSDFGWSVLLNTASIGRNADPADVVPELLSIFQGTPFSEKTQEWKQNIRDGVGFLTSNNFSKAEPHRGATYIPRSIATIGKIKQYWTSRPGHFELSHYISIEPSQEWKQYPKVGDFEEILGCREMQDMLWRTFTTERCDHVRQIEPKRERLGPDVVALMGFCEPAPYDKDEGVAERILLYLTKGEPLLRWYAVKEAVSSQAAYGEYGRSVMLRGRRTCDACALEQVATCTGRWALIL